MGLGGVVDPEVNSGYHRAPLQIAPNISSAEGEVPVTPRRRTGGCASAGQHSVALPAQAGGFANGARRSLRRDGRQPR